MRMPQQENRDIDLMIGRSLQLTIDMTLAHEFRIRLDRAREAIESHKVFVIVDGQRAGSALKLCGRKFGDR
jgi:hypothetical protein